jgi:hypothetical protein
MRMDHLLRQIPHRIKIPLLPGIDATSFIQLAAVSEHRLLSRVQINNPLAKSRGDAYAR